LDYQLQKKDVNPIKQYSNSSSKYSILCTYRNNPTDGKAALFGTITGLFGTFSFSLVECLAKL